METWKEKTRRHLISAALTFGSTFLLTFLSLLMAVMDGGEALTTALFFSMASGALIAGMRAVVKYLYELLAKDIKVTKLEK